MGLEDKLNDAVEDASDETQEATGPLKGAKPFKSEGEGDHSKVGEEHFGADAKGPLDS